MCCFSGTDGRIQIVIMLIKFIVKYNNMKADITFQLAQLEFNSNNEEIKNTLRTIINKIPGTIKFELEDKDLDNKYKDLVPEKSIKDLLKNDDSLRIFISNKLLEKIGTDLIKLNKTEFLHNWFINNLIFKVIEVKWHKTD